MKNQKKYWLMKTEPGSYSIDDLQKDKITFWSGVRNYQARNFLRDDIKKGNEVLVYHSNAEPSGIVGVAKVIKEGYPDPTAFDPKSQYFDETSSMKDPRWFVVDIQFVKKFDQILSLQDLKMDPMLDGMELLRKGQRLSVLPVSEKHFLHVLGQASRSPKR